MRPVFDFRFQSESLHRIRRLFREPGNGAEAVLAEDQDIRLHDWRLLSAVHDREEITGSQAGPLVLLNKMQPSTGVANLIAFDLLVSSTSKSDGRVAPLHLTRKGTALFELLSRRMAALELWALEGLTLMENRMLDPW